MFVVKNGYRSRTLLRGEDGFGVPTDAGTELLSVSSVPIQCGSSDCTNYLRGDHRPDEDDESDCADDVREHPAAEEIRPCETSNSDETDREEHERDTEGCGDAFAPRLAECVTTLSKERAQACRVFEDDYRNDEERQESPGKVE
ncbi:hypothetical protein HFX_6415 (plasmid) [Haloferax mediterranei ATCC 33500]|uniref:Uncharacterized protein n=1 Tax=Haloferax mediterranei (strain ATCC 33500 / DSM 1411 / JCM 8866 / NBRC 14739 / NCIMB 2177 / R-4) TaxID=523841 RepID=I3RBC4_HALMT|nr:hypothetical protein HFX_6415 [Haloferax mediterranei ATCC 33500]